MIINRKNAKAKAVLCIIADRDEEFLQNCLIEPYLNGREQGYSIWFNGYRMAWSEYRNTDNFVVYEGESSEFNMQGNVPSEEIYKNKKFFDYNQYVDVAIYILEILKRHS
jgi:hypothetical protein